MKTLYLVAGARPNFMKIAPRAARARRELRLANAARVVIGNPI